MPSTRSDDALVLKEAAAEDCDLLVSLMAEFYAESGYLLNRERARVAFDHLLRNPGAGRVWILRHASEDAGYIVLTLGYSMEYGGTDAFVDDLYVRSGHRGRGLGRMALNAVRQASELLGVRAIHLEVGRDNHAAQSLYRKAGFVDNDRQLLTLRLAEPTHE